MYNNDVDLWLYHQIVGSMTRHALTTSTEPFKTFTAASVKENRSVLTAEEVSEDETSIILASG